MQRDLVVNGEANKMFLRSKDELQGEDFYPITWICEQLEPFRDSINSVLEIGSSNGAKLRQMCRLLNCKGFGIDPSRLAVEDGNAKGGVTLTEGSAARLAFATASFDVVYFGFCLYMVDRGDLLASIAEASRVLKPGGFLVITDFDPIQKHSREYHHQAGMLTHKQDYAACFTATGMYHVVSKRSFAINSQTFAFDGDDRVSTVILYKEPTL